MEVDGRRVRLPLHGRARGASRVRWASASATSPWAENFGSSDATELAERTRPSGSRGWTVSLSGTLPDAVRRSALVITADLRANRALCAARPRRSRKIRAGIATGYRYCWLRDASYGSRPSFGRLLTGGRRFINWIRDRAYTTTSRCRSSIAVDGDPHLPNRSSSTSPGSRRPAGAHRQPCLRSAASSMSSGGDRLHGRLPAQGGFISTKLWHVWSDWPTASGV